MGTVKFTGKADTFVVSCQKCDDSLSTEPVSQPLLAGTRVTCDCCDATGLAYDDGGIYKLAGGDDSIQMWVA